MKAAAQEKAGTGGETDRGEQGAERFVAWLKANQRRLSIAGTLAVVVAGGVWFTISARQRREAFAERELQSARLAAESGNLALAANDLSRLVSSYAGTSAADEAQLVLGQVRLLAGQTDVAIADLERFVAQGPSDRYRVAAFGLLGAALEQAGRFSDAGQAYVRGADGPGFDLVRADLLMHAGRSFAEAGDTTQAAAAYRRVLEFDGAPRAVEARLRLGELRRFDPSE